MFRPASCFIRLKGANAADAVSLIVMTLSGRVLVESQKIMAPVLIRLHQDKHHNTLAGMARANKHGAAATCTRNLHVWLVGTQCLLVGL